MVCDCSSKFPFSLTQLHCMEQGVFCCRGGRLYCQIPVYYTPAETTFWNSHLAIYFRCVLGKAVIEDYCDMHCRIRDVWSPQRTVSCGVSSGAIFSSDALSFSSFVAWFYYSVLNNCEIKLRHDGEHQSNLFCVLDCCSGCANALPQLQWNKLVLSSRYLTSIIKYFEVLALRCRCKSVTGGAWNQETDAVCRGAKMKQKYRDKNFMPFSSKQSGIL